MWRVWGRVEVDTGFLWVNLKTRDHLEDLREMEGESKNGSSRNRMGRVVWIDLAHDMGRWRAVVNTVMNLRVI
jgi:hypothetical protein